MGNGAKLRLFNGEVEMNTVAANKPEARKNLEIAGLLCFFILIGTALFVDNWILRLPLLCCLTLIVLIFGVADIFGKGVRLRWRMVNVVMVLFVLWHLPDKILFFILILTILIRMALNRPVPLC